MTYQYAFYAVIHLLYMLSGHTLYLPELVHSILLIQKHLMKRPALRYIRREEVIVI